jgi:hypothetical protein
LKRVANVELLAEVTIDWDITYNGEKPKFTKARRPKKSTKKSSG